MSGWHWFWTVVGFVLFIIVLIFLYYYAPFEQLFVLVLNGISFSNVIFWVALIVGIVGFWPCSTGMPTGCTSPGSTAST